MFFDVSSLMIAENGHNTYNGALNGALNESVLELYHMIKRKAGVNRKELSVLLNKSESTLDKQLKILIKHQYIERQGSRKTGGYVVIKEYF